MSVVIGLVDGNRIWMAGDSCEGSSDNKAIDSRADEKVFIRESGGGLGIPNKWIFGYAGSWRLGQILKYELDLPANYPKLGDSVHEFMCKAFIFHLRAAFARNDYKASGEFLVGCYGHLYTIWTDTFQVAESRRPYTAIGSGSQVAKGCLYGCYYNPTLKPAEKLQTTLEAASEFTPFVRPPYTICHLDF